LSARKKIADQIEALDGLFSRYVPAASFAMAGPAVVLLAVLYAASPLFIAALTPAVEGKRVPRAALQAILLGWGGLLVVLSGALTASSVKVWAALAVLGAVVCQGYCALLAKRRLGGAPMLRGGVAPRGIVEAPEQREPVVGAGR